MRGAIFNFRHCVECIAHIGSHPSGSFRVESAQLTSRPLQIWVKLVNLWSLYKWVKAQNYSPLHYVECFVKENSNEWTEFLFTFIPESEFSQMCSDVIHRYTSCDVVAPKCHDVFRKSSWEPPLCCYFQG